MLVVADFNQFCSRDSSFSSKPEDAIVFYFPELITLFIIITITALLSISTVKESLLLWMDKNQDPAFPSCMQSSSPLRAPVFLSNWSQLLHSDLAMQVASGGGNTITQHEWIIKANNTSHIYDYINDILPVSQEIYNTQSVSAGRKGSKFLWDFYKLWNSKIDIYETVNWEGVTLDLLHC